MTSFAISETRAELMEMLRTRRPHGSKAEESFIRKWIDPLGAECDGFGNRIVRVGKAPRVLWSSHTDTVHSKGGAQAIQLRGDTIRISPRGKSNCLGADCTSGVWLMRQMIRRGVPGLYVFHRAEECGGLGSNYIAEESPELLTGIEIAIALDRKGKDSVITYQGDRCASDAFAESLAAQLGSDWRPDDSGLFTDTANYTHIIPECTNISVGYAAQHTSKETQDLPFLEMLLERLCALDTDSLVVARNPEEIEAWESQAEYEDDSAGPIGLARFNAAFLNRQDSRADKELVRAVCDYPGVVAEILEDYGLDVDAILQAAYDKDHKIPY